MVVFNLANVLTLMVRKFGYYRTISERLLYVYPSLVEWSLSCRLLLGNDSWFLNVALHERCGNDIHHCVGVRFFPLQWSAKRQRNVLVSHLWCYHVLCSIWEGSGPRVRRRRLCYTPGCLYMTSLLPFTFPTGTTEVMERELGAIMWTRTDQPPSAYSLSLPLGPTQPTMKKGSATTM